MFRSFGHERSSILDGGLPRWEAEGFTVENAPPPSSTPSKPSELVKYPPPSLKDGTIQSEYAWRASFPTMDEFNHRSTVQVTKISWPTPNRNLPKALEFGWFSMRARRTGRI